MIMPCSLCSMAKSHHFLPITHYSSSGVRTYRLTVDGSRDSFLLWPVSRRDKWSPSYRPFRKELSWHRTFNCYSLKRCLSATTRWVVPVAWVVVCSLPAHTPTWLRAVLLWLVILAPTSNPLSLFRHAHRVDGTGRCRLCPQLSGSRGLCGSVELHPWSPTSHE